MHDLSDIFSTQTDWLGFDRRVCTGRVNSSIAPRMSYGKGVRENAFLTN